MQGIFNIVKEKQTDASIVRVLDLTEMTFGSKYPDRV